ncbi:hypothetical protein [Nocardioides daejeonensis]|nr:hypothetical protein [Nocardioides daejeonensis]
MDTTNYYFARAELAYRQEQARREVRSARRKRRQDAAPSSKPWDLEGLR